jgi:uncharacterized membrane protein YfcA
MTGSEILVLGVLAFATSALSAVIGMAGGIILLSVMLLYMDPLLALPLHGVVQLVSNGSRTWVQRRHVSWQIAAPYTLLLLPAAWLGVKVALRLPPDGVRAAIGAFVLLATWRPGWLLLGTHPEQVDPRRRFALLGGVVGFLNMIVGATGPLLAPFFLNLGLPRQGLIGTKAACQALGHVSKVLLFGLVGFAFADHVPLLALMCAMVVAGTAVGSRLLDRIDERTFVWLYKTALTLVALRLLVVELWRAVTGG